MSEFFCPQKDFISPDFSEVARYLGYSKKNVPEEPVSLLIKKACEELAGLIAPQAVFDTYDLSVQPPDKISFADVNLRSKDLTRNLGGAPQNQGGCAPDQSGVCTKIVLLAATIGPQVDACIRKNQHLDKTYAAILQAAGAMYIESVVNLLNEQIKSEATKKGLCARPRFSPGFGDVSLEVQKTFFSLLPCNRIGLTLMDSLIMAPEKSITAFIGLYSK